MSRLLRRNKSEWCAGAHHCERMQELWDLLLSTDGTLVDPGVLWARADEIENVLTLLIKHAYEYGHPLPPVYEELLAAARREVRRQMAGGGMPIGGARPREN
jgi:hypothetical protein